VVGAAKAGTTSLYEYLRQHPEIFMSTEKEPQYFVHGGGMGDWEKYQALFQDAGNKKIMGECSAGYLYSPESPRWIQSELGSIPIVILLRQPARRAYSAYCWMAQEGYEDAPTFSRALELEEARRRDPVFQKTCPQFFPDYLYFAMGLYCQQVRRYFDTFGPDRVRVYLFEEFVQQPLAVCRDIFEFLGVRADFTPQLAVHNQSRLPASIARQYWLRNQAPRVLRLAPKALRGRLIQRLMERNLRHGPAPRPGGELQAALLKRYEEDIRKTEELLRRDLSLWLKA
jgi:hypothetical protein